MSEGVTLWKNNRSPSLTDTISVDGVAFDLTGSTVKLQARFEGSSTLKIDTAATVVTPAAGTVRYDWAALDVDTAGDLIAWWRVTLPSAKTQDTPEFSVFILDHTDVIPGRDLCLITDVQRYIPGYTPDSETDNTLRALISAESQTIHNNTRREFVAIGTNPQARAFDLTAYDVDKQILDCGDLASTPTTVAITAIDGTAVQTVTAAAIINLPRLRQAWQPITGLWFPSGAAVPAALGDGYVITVTGTFGFPSIPPDVREACAKMVIVRYLSDVARAGTDLSDALASVSIGGLIVSAREALDLYRIPTVA